MTKQQDFLNKIRSGAENTWVTFKILPSLVGAQAVLESGWGESSLATEANNLFGVKASGDWKGEVYRVPTKEFLNGSWVTIDANFRKYKSWADSVTDHGNFFTESDFRKNNYKHLIGETDYKKAVHAILPPVATYGYATDPNYATKIINIIEEHRLYEWDTIATGKENNKEDNKVSYTVKKQIRAGLPQVGVTPYRQVHAHSTGNPNSTAQNEADYMGRKNINDGFYTHVVGNGIVIQTANVNRGAYDVGGGWNAEGYASVELIESHKSKAEFERDYNIYVELLRDLAKQGGIPLTLDSSALEGIKTHNYCTHNQPNNGSDHIDPIPYLTKWGVSQAQFAKDLANGVGTGGNPTPNPTPAQKTVTIAKHATHYSPSSKGAKISDWVKGSTFAVKEERAIKYSNSNREYLITNKGVPLGWVLSQDIVGGYNAGNKPAPEPAPSNTGEWIAENGTFVPKMTLPLTVDASGNGALIANIGAGQAIKYNAYMIDSKYVWIRQPRGNGYGYMATGNAKNGKRVDYWGSFS